MKAIVDIQGFKTDDNKFILKEISIYYENHIQTFLVRQPFPFYDLSKSERKQVHWIERNRGIYWSEGFIPYSNYKNVIVSILKDKFIFTKGDEKVRWMKEITENNNVYNLENENCPSLLSLYEQYKSSNDLYNCVYHNNVCALKNVLCLRKWCLDNKIILK